MSRPRRRIFAIVATALVAGALPACAPATATTPDWRPCPERPGLECATIPVPVDWSDPGGARIEIAVILDRVDDPRRRVGTLVSLPGGPGSSGIDEIMRGGKFSPGLHDRFDIVSLDPRGVRRSHPMRCDSGLVQDRPGLVPDAGGRFDEVRAYARDLADSCREYTGALVDHLDAVSVARDIEAMRGALGADRLSLYGRSYGTMPAQAYAELFPDRLRAVVLDSVDDHSLTGPEFVTSSARAGEDAITEFIGWCARNPGCALHGQDIGAMYTDLFAAATAGRLRDPRAPQQPVAPLELSQRVTARLYGPEWPALAADLRAFSEQPLGAPVAATRPARSGTPVEFPAIAVCSDWDFRVGEQADWLRQWQEQNAQAPTLRAHFAWAAGSICAGGWPAPANPPHVPRDTGAPPILILNSRHDPATPHEWATGVAARTPRATLLTYAGHGHGIYGRTPCTTAAGDRYLIDLEMPAARLCPAA
ncbi:alpha/beta hydrolase [Nocardia sp. NPDC003345]